MRKISKLMVGYGCDVLERCWRSRRRSPTPIPTSGCRWARGRRPRLCLPLGPIMIRSRRFRRRPCLAPGVTEQAGVGGTQAYARAGVLELGGSGGFAAASNYTRFELSPSIGLFLVDNLELSLLTGFNYFSVGATDDGRARPAPPSSRR